MKIKRCVLILISLILMLSLSACGDRVEVKVGVLMPSTMLERWNKDGHNIEKNLTDLGYTVDLRYAENNVGTQQKQLKEMIDNDYDYLVITAIDGYSLSDLLVKAKEKNITVIAYDRLIMNSDAVEHYVTFDNYMVGKLQGAFIRDSLDLENNSGPFNVEIVTGDVGDNNVVFYFDGSMLMLNPYIAKGVVKVPSGETTIDKCNITNWNTALAMARMLDLIKEQGYAPDGKKLDAVLVSNDSCASGVIMALKESGYTAENIPIVTGQDCDVQNVKYLEEGLQGMSVFKDTRELAKKTAKLIEALVKGKEFKPDDTARYNNDVKVVPTYLCTPVKVTLDNYEKILFNSGYYHESDFN